MLGMSKEDPMVLPVMIIKVNLLPMVPPGTPLVIPLGTLVHRRTHMVVEEPLLGVDPLREDPLMGVVDVKTLMDLRDRKTGSIIIQMDKKI